MRPEEFDKFSDDVDWALQRAKDLACLSILGAACYLATGCTPAVAPSPDASDAAPAHIDGGALHSYTCSLDGGIAWTCQDGLSQPVGTCAKYGCAPVP